MKMKTEEILARMEEDIQLHGLSKGTSVNYLYRAKKYLIYAGKPVEEIDEQDIRKYLLYLINETKLSPSSVNNSNAAIRFLFAVTLNRNLNYRQIPRLKRNKRLPNVLTKEEIEKIIGACFNIKTKSIFMTIYSSGIRIHELVTLKISDIDSKSMRIFVDGGKGGKDRYTILSQICLETLREYWKEYKPKYWLFENRAKTNHIPDDNVQNAFKSAVKRAGIKKDVSVHTLRHSFATHLLENGTSILIIKELLGHADIQSTTLYLHLSNFTSNIKSPLDVLPKRLEEKSGPANG
jgi:integrase/recombinase XerD